MAYLVVRTKGKPALRLTLTGPVVMGRALKCNVWLDDPALSREHCRFESENNRWFVVDLRSRNGTYVGTQPVDRYPLVDGEMVRIGSTQVEFHEGVQRAADPEQDQLSRLLANTEKSTPPESKSRPPASFPRPKPIPKSEVPAVPSIDLESEAVDADAQLNAPHPPPTPRPVPRVRPAQPSPKPEKRSEDQQGMDNLA